MDRRGFGSKQDFIPLFFFMFEYILWQGQKAVLTIVEFEFVDNFYSKFQLVSTFSICSEFCVENWLLCFDMSCKWVTCRSGCKRFWKSALHMKVPIFHKPSSVPIGLQLFKGDPINKNQHFPPNLASDDPWPWYVTFDLINIWRNPYCIFDPSLVVIGLLLLKGDPNTENLTKLEHTGCPRKLHTAKADFFF